MENDPPPTPIPDDASSIADEAAELTGGLSPDAENHAGNSALMRVPSPQHSGWQSRGDGAASDQPSPARTWHQELPRWLATLDSGRTRREYEKAVTYFFTTPGVPDRLEELTLDLLLAYRGSLALRAERQPARRPSSQAAPTPWGRSRLGGSGPDRLSPGAGAGASEHTTESGGPLPNADSRAASPLPASPLAPATVNLRLTALRQFLAHCSLWGRVPQLSPERTRAALRRLAVERRRPYQILAEPEWAGFLEAARAPLERARQTAEMETPFPSAARPPSASGGDEMHVGESESAPARHSSGPHSPWGMPRAVKARVTAERSTTASRSPGAITRAMHGAESTTTHSAEPNTPRRTEPTPPTASSTEHAATPIVRSAAGMTGERTAQRDHALLALALATGLRAVELSLLDLGDLSREWHAGRQEWWLILPDAKTKGQHGGRTLPLSPELVQTLLDYVRSTGRDWERAADRGTPLFLPLGCGPGRTGRRDGASRPPRRLSLAQIRCIVDRAEAQWLAAHGDGEVGRGSRAISPHALRHSTAIALLEGNVRTSRPPASVEHVRGWLGHVDIRTTQGYLAHLDDRRHHRPFVLEPIADSSTGDDAAPKASRDAKE